MRGDGIDLLFGGVWFRNVLRIVHTSLPRGGETRSGYLPILPLWLAFFKQRAQSLLGILEAGQFVPENVYPIFPRAPQRHSPPPPPPFSCPSPPPPRLRP